MNWIAFSAIAAVLGPIASVAVGAFVYGRLTQSVVDNKSKTDEHGGILVKHAEKLGDHGERLSKVEEWKAGIKIGARIPQ